jgi:thioredoxin reductase
LKPKNKEKINKAIEDSSIQVIYNSNLVTINEKSVLLKVNDEEITREIENDLVYIFAGGELPTTFLEKAGINITKRFGYIMKKHK